MNWVLQRLGIEAGTLFKDLDDVVKADVLVGMEYVVAQRELRDPDTGEPKSGMPTLDPIAEEAMIGVPADAPGDDDIPF